MRVVPAHLATFRVRIPQEHGARRGRRPACGSLSHRQYLPSGVAWCGPRSPRRNEFGSPPRHGVVRCGTSPSCIIVKSTRNPRSRSASAFIRSCPCRDCTCPIQEHRFIGVSRGAEHPAGVPRSRARRHADHAASQLRTGSRSGNGTPDGGAFLCNSADRLSNGEIRASAAGAAGKRGVRGPMGAGVERLGRLRGSALSATWSTASALFNASHRGPRM